jgi:hypothetical protein
MAEQFAKKAFVFGIVIEAALVWSIARTVRASPFSDRHLRLSLLRIEIVLIR